MTADNRLVPKRSEYDVLQNATLIEATGIEEFPMALIRARIARSMTQRELSDYPTGRGSNVVLARRVVVQLVDNVG